MEHRFNLEIIKSGNEVAAGVFVVLFPHHCFATDWKMSQLPELGCVSDSVARRIIDFPSERQELFGVTRPYFSLLF